MDAGPCVETGIRQSVADTVVGEKNRCIRIDPRVSAGLNSVAVRVPDHAVARALASAAGGLITSTSANRSGEPPVATAAEVARALGRASLFILDGGPTPGGPVSTIVDVCGPRPRLIRTGRVPFDRVLESLQ